MVAGQQIFELHEDGNVGRTAAQDEGRHLRNAAGRHGDEKITGDEAEEFAPSWSKDGKRIYFGSSVGGGKVSNIYSTKTDGSGLRQLTKDAGHNASPVVSPDGKWIVYNAETVEHKPQIYVMKTDGSGIQGIDERSDSCILQPKLVA